MKNIEKSQIRQCRVFPCLEKVRKIIFIKIKGVKITLGLCLDHFEQIKDGVDWEE